MGENQNQYQMFAPSKSELKKSRKQFFVWSALAILFVLIINSWSGEELLLISLKAAFAPIYVLALQAHSVFWPKLPEENLPRVLIRNAIISLIFAFTMLVMTARPERSIEALANSFGIAFTIFFLGMMASEILMGGSGAKRFFDQKY